MVDLLVNGRAGSIPHAAWIENLHSYPLYPNAVKLQDRGWRTFPVKGQIIYGFGFVCHMVSISTTELCPCAVKATIDTRKSTSVLCSSRMLFIQACGWLDLARRLQVTNPCSSKSLASAGTTDSVNVSHIWACISVLWRTCWNTCGSNPSPEFWCNRSGVEPYNL